jgi:putative membrane protein
MPEPDNSQQIEMMKQMVGLAERQVVLSVERSRMSAERSEMSEARSYMNAERTLSVWLRTALASMIFGIAVDRFDLLLQRSPASAASGHPGRAAVLNGVSTWTGAALVLLGIIMALATGGRFLAYARTWHRRHEAPAHHGPYLAPSFALLVALFGILLLVIMLAFAG